MENNLKSANGIMSGIQNVEAAVIKTAHERGLRISEDNFLWNAPAVKSTPFISVHIIANARVAGLFLPTECFEESANGVTRLETWDAIGDCINALLGSVDQRQIQSVAALH